MLDMVYVNTEKKNTNEKEISSASVSSGSRALCLCLGMSEGTWVEQFFPGIPQATLYTTSLLWL